LLKAANVLVVEEEQDSGYTTNKRMLVTWKTKGSSSSSVSIWPFIISSLVSYMMMPFCSVASTSSAA